MSELIADLPYRVLGSSGLDYYPSVVAEQRPDGQWEAWLEYVSDDELDALLTDTETTQSSRDDVVRWAAALSETYVQGAFARAVTVTAGIPSRLVARRMPVEVVHSVSVGDADVPDPFALFASGPLHLRAALQPLSRSTLLATIDAHGLNPVKRSLAWLSQPQLVTFIVTAVEVQVRIGKRSI
jgi:hypothetical protein